MSLFESLTVGQRWALKNGMTVRLTFVEPFMDDQMLLEVEEDKQFGGMVTYYRDGRRLRREDADFDLVRLVSA